MTPQEAQAIADKVRIAHEALAEASRLSERVDVKLACQLGGIKDRLVVIEAKVSTKLEQKPQTLRQFARQHRL